MFQIPKPVKLVATAVANPTKAEVIYRFFDYYNLLLFNSLLINTTIKIICEPVKNHGRCIHSYANTFLGFVQRYCEIEISDKSELEQIRVSLIYQMIEAATWIINSDPKNDVIRTAW